MRVFIVVSFHSAREAFHRLPVEKVFIFFFLCRRRRFRRRRRASSRVFFSPSFFHYYFFFFFFFFFFSSTIFLGGVVRRSSSRRPPVKGGYGRPVLVQMFAFIIISLHLLLLRVFVLLERSRSTPLDAFSNGVNTANRRDTGATQPHVSRSSSPVSVFDQCRSGGRLLCSPLLRRRRRLFRWKAFVFVFSPTPRRAFILFSLATLLSSLVCLVASRSLCR